LTSDVIFLTPGGREWPSGGPDAPEASVGGSTRCIVVGMLTRCPRCQGPLTIQPKAKKLGETAEVYEDCNRICPRCDIGLSNAKGRPTFIRRDWRDGLWRRSTAARLEHILARALAVRARTKKLRRMANERSEDLLTWNVFSWLEDRRLLGHVIRLIGLTEESDDVKVFYWGCNDRHKVGMNLDMLMTVTFHEHPASLSEPDVILIGSTALVIIEAKLASPNDRQPGKKMDQYVTPAMSWFRASVDEISQAGYYELTRNWAIGGMLANRLDRRLALVNLVREGQEEQIDLSFRSLIANTGTFRRLTWEHLVTSVEPALGVHLRDETLYFKPAFPSLTPAVK
jgi:hypothetical protein